MLNSGTTPAISGVTTADMVLVGVQGSALPMPVGITLNVSVTATNEITLRVQNYTGGSVAVDRYVRLLVVGAA